MSQQKPLGLLCRCACSSLGTPVLRMASFLQSMGISTEDVWTLFMPLERMFETPRNANTITISRIMDADRSGLIDLEEHLVWIVRSSQVYVEAWSTIMLRFVSGCMKKLWSH